MAKISSSDIRVLENENLQGEAKHRTKSPNSGFDTIELEHPRLKPILGANFSEVEDTFRPYLRLITIGSKTCELVKTIIVSFTLLPIRVIFLLIFMMLYIMIAKIATICLKKDDSAVFRPLPMWRAMMMMLFKPLTRALLFTVFGVYRIKRHKLEWGDLPKVPEQDPPTTSAYDKPYVIVANHLGYLDILVLLATHGGAFVAKGAIAKTPVVGTVATALQTLYVRKGVPLTQAIIDRVSTTYECHQFSNPSHEFYHNKKTACGSCLSTLTIFPEGTTTNGSAMVKFRTGVFNAGKPVLPIAIKFPNKHFSLSWETISFKKHLFCAMTQIWNNVEVAELPFYHPNEAEMENSRLYAENVQYLLAAALDQKVYPLNRKQKFTYHEYVLGKKNKEEALAKAAEQYNEDKLLHPEDEAI
mmetsp:Transcript_7896/g.10508  ORF Transcript_7896/g.10508 Transcript_7896/m.10508 type:complete len:415 (+) Transcript_7896:59-1303(+)